MTEREQLTVIRGVLEEELGYSRTDHFVQRSDLYGRWEIWRGSSGDPLFGGTLRAILRAIRREIKPKKVGVA